MVGRRTAPKIISQTMACLLLGAVINIAVAWTAGTLTNYAFMNAVDLTPSDIELLRNKRDALTPPSDLATLGFGERRTNAAVTFLFLGNCAIWKQGWPARSMIGESTDQNEGFVGTACLFRIIPAPMHRDPHFKRLSVIALKPLWPGFAINTLLYAATLYLLFTTPAKLRRHRRIKRNLCPACAYPVGESDNCTECGRALRTR